MDDGAKGEEEESGEPEQKKACRCPFTIYVKLLQFIAVIAIAVLQVQLYTSVRNIVNLNLR